ncbi:MAG TPA: class IV adenylate cyclase [Gemmataceae bacterium]|jgi:adenylate cyclase class 2|nr:class IV adenylate cyclase [Gemmataceae bacterium]
MVEVEIKYLAPSEGDFERQLGSLGAGFVTERQESDRYFNAPDRDFRQTDEALRIREVGSAVKLTYKGPKRDLLTKTRTEIEVPLVGEEGAAESMAQVLTSLGYRPVGSVRKSRRVYRLVLAEFTAEICLDSIAGLGAYVELEIVVDEEQVDGAREALLRLAEKLGLSNPERRSYLQLALSQGGADK